MFAAWFVLLSLSLAPAPLNSMLIGLILYGLVRKLTCGMVRQQLGREDSDPAKAVSTVVGLALTGIGIFLTVLGDSSNADFSWIIGAGITLVLYAYGMPWVVRLRQRDSSKNLHS